jgi:hypothetical protein
MATAELKIVTSSSGLTKVDFLVKPAILLSCKQKE